MSQAGTPAALLAALLAVLLGALAVLPPPAAGAKPAQVTCSSFGRGFCGTSCRFDLVRKTCCRCFGDCCPTEVGGGQQAPGDDDLLEDVADGGDSAVLEEETSQQAAEEPGDKQISEQLVAAPRFGGFIPTHGFQPISTLPTVVPSPSLTTCVELGFPGDVRELGAVWFSLARPCQVLKCIAGVIKVILDNCGTQPPPSPSPTASNPVGNFLPCTDTETGRTYLHGATWASLVVNCLVFRCMNGAVHVASMNCASTAAPAPEPAVTPPPVPWSPPSSGPDAPDGGDEESHCEDDFGQVQANGNVWTVPTRPCLRYRCHDGTILSSVITCPPPTGDDCSTVPPPPGRCCPSYRCQAPPRPRDCVQAARTYSSGSVFADDPQHPCQQRKCDDGLVVALSPPTVCAAVFCPDPDWPEGACCKTCPANTLPDGLEELKQLVLRMGQRLNLSAELMSRLEDSVSRLVAQLAALMRDSDGTVTLQTLVASLKETTSILIELDTSTVDSPLPETEVLLVQLRASLLALLERLRPTLNDDQIYNANIDINELTAWLRAFRTAGRTNAATILMNDLTRLFSGLLMEPGCTDSVGTVHSVDTLYVDDPGSPRICFVCASLTSGVSPLPVMNVSDCGGPPPPGCSARLLPNSCCPLIECSAGEAACRDDQGKLHPHGSTYFDDPSQPCITYNCTDGTASIVDRISCMPIPPGCTPWRREGFCCPKSDCPAASCVHEGSERDDRTTWPQEPLKPCLILTCLMGQVSYEDRSSYCPPPPAEHCVPRQVNYQCCPEYDCVTVNCTYSGRVYREGQEWPDHPQHPCRRYRCTRQGTEKIEDVTDLCEPQPHAVCTSTRVTGQCCKQWNCPKCTYKGRTYSEGDVFWDDPNRRCAQIECRAGETIQRTPQITCPPIPEGCTPNYDGTGCCHVKYTCPFCMFDPQGNLLRSFGGAYGSPDGS